MTVEKISLHCILKEHLIAISLKFNSHARTFFVRPCECEMDSFILFLKEKFRICELPYESTTEGLTNFRNALRTVV